MTVVMAPEALKRDLLIVQLLDMGPFPHGELNSFREAFLKVNLNTNSSAGKLIAFRRHTVQEMPKLVSNVLQRFSPPKMQAKILR